MFRRSSLLVVLACLGIAACSGQKNNSSWSTAKSDHQIQPALDSAKPAPEPATDGAKPSEGAASDTTAAKASGGS